jgi:hypothetical protein
METRPGIALHKLVLGLCLVTVGVAAFLGSIDVWNIRHFWRFWPLFLIAIGLSSEIEALGRRKGDGGYILIAIGCWMLAGSFHFMNLSMAEAMPIGIAVAGLFLVLHAVMDRPAVKGEENDNVC